MAALFDIDDIDDIDDTDSRPGFGESGKSGFDDVSRAQRVLDDAKASHSLRLALDHARHVGGRGGLRLLGDFSRQIAAAESEILASYVAADGDTRAAERAVADGKTSKREQRKKASRAKAVGQNSGLADKLADGALSEEQIDVIADVAAKTDGEAAVDEDLIDEIGSVPPEQGKVIADRYLADRATADGVQSEHDRQRAVRKASKYNSKKKGLDAITIEGDGVAIKAMWDAIEGRSDDLYRADGGRDLKAKLHPRTNDHRKFDAAHDLICGTAVTDPASPDPANTDSADADADGGQAAATAKQNESRRSRRYTAPKTRPRIVVSLTVDKLLGRDPASVAIQHGYGPIPDSVLADYAADADIFAALFDRNGEPMWLARLNRYASSTQMIALIVRDGGCVLCGADHTRCQAHHSMPWNAPAKGRTDLDLLVLLCGPCHSQLHGEQQTIYRTANGAWRTRPATFDELPPPRPHDARNLPQRK